jgi:hypothetical protein
MGCCGTNLAVSLGCGWIVLGGRCSGGGTSLAVKLVCGLIVLGGRCSGGGTGLGCIILGGLLVCSGGGLIVLGGRCCSSSTGLGCIILRHLLLQGGGCLSKVLTRESSVERCLKVRTQDNLHVEWTAYPFTSLSDTSQSKSQLLVLGDEVCGN